MHTSQGLRTLWLLLGATLVAAAPARAQRPAAEASATVVSLRREAERAVAELGAARARLVHFEEGVRSPQGLTEAQVDSLARLRRLLAIAEMRAVEANARHRVQLRLAQAARARAEQVGPVSAAGPEGYFGVAVSQPSDPRPRGAPAEHPRVATVEPGSPAAKAGLRAGDRLVRVGTVVLRQGGDLGAVLRPGNVVRVLYERDGRMQEADVRIEPRPLSYRSGLSVTIREVPGEQPTVRMLPAPDVQVLTTVGPETGAVMRREVLRGALPGGGSSLVIMSRRTSVVAGAEIMQLDDNLRRAFGVRHGLYVLNVVPGLHAGRAGVRQGDVILRAGDLTLDTPADLIRAIGARIETERRDLRLDLLRDSKVRTVELTWRAADRNP